MLAIALTLSLLTPMQREEAPVVPKAPTPAPVAKPGPKSDDPVVELLDENVATIIEAIAGTADQADLKVERGDVYTGLESLKQTGQERHIGTLKGWGFKIVEKPTGANEFRFIRFAWKKEGGGSVLLGFANDNSWSGKRYAAGEYGLGAQGVKIAEKAPVEWTVVTRDIYKDFGAFGLTGILFSSAGAGTSRFDQVILGRSIADLDVATDLALGKAKAKIALSGTARDEAWADLIGDDRTKASIAFRTFIPVAGDQVEFIGKNLPQKKVDAAKLTRVRTLIAALNSEDFEARIAADVELVKIGESAIPILRAALESGDDAETQFRAKAILKKLSYSPSDVLPRASCACSNGPRRRSRKRCWRSSRPGSSAAITRAKRPRR